jgi:hypothetical protein
MKSKLIPLAMALALSACSAKDNASTASSGATSAAASPAPATSTVASAGDPSANDISNYTLDMDKMNRWMNTMKALAAEARKDSTIEDALSMDADKSVAQTVAKMESFPAAKRALASSGMSASDYVMTSLAYMQAAMAAGMVKSVPNYKVPAGQNLKNIEFYNQHGAEIDKQMKQMNSEASN